MTSQTLQSWKYSWYLTAPFMYTTSLPAGACNVLRLSKICAPKQRKQQIPIKRTRKNWQAWRPVLVEICSAVRPRQYDVSARTLRTWFLKTRRCFAALHTKRHRTANLCFKGNERGYGRCCFSSGLHSTKRFDIPSVPKFSGKKSHQNMATFPTRQ
jgi:hypothetical protein